MPGGDVVSSESFALALLSAASASLRGDDSEAIDFTQPGSTGSLLHSGEGLPEPSVGARSGERSGNPLVWYSAKGPFRGLAGAVCP